MMYLIMRKKAICIRMERMKRIVIKIGTNVLTGEDGFLDLKVVRSIVEQVAEIKKEYEVILVASGAVAAGRMLLGRSPNGVIRGRQLLAAVGQVKMVETFGQLFRKKGYNCAQVLATKEDFRDRRHYLCMRSCLSALLHDDVIPIANENDVVAVDELMFTDNDELAGLIASMLDVERVILLTSVEGLYENFETKKVISKIDPTETKATKYASKQAPRSSMGRGGMHTKCRVATKLSELGIVTHIVDGGQRDVLLDVVAGKEIGTTFLPTRRKSSIKKWIAQTGGHHKGVIHVNDCAEDVLKDPNVARSLLPVGVTKVDGSFVKGDIVEVVNPKGKVIAYGVAQYGSEVATANIGQKNKKPVIHYDYLWIESL